MCYGKCSYENYPSGECDGWLLHCSDKIKEATGYSPCFIGGYANFQEEVDYYNELLANGTIEKYKKIVEDILESELRKR